MAAVRARELFRAMLPWETVRSLLSLISVTESQIQKDSWTSEYSTSLVPTSDREFYIELPAEAKAPVDGDAVGGLAVACTESEMQATIGCEIVRSLLQSEGSAAGKDNPALFFNKQ